MKVAIVLRESNGKTAELAREVAEWLRKRHRDVFADDTDARTLKVARLESRAKLARECDLIIVFGGDGTLLSTARDVAPSRTPVLGINLGRLGFLAEVSPRRMYPLLDKILEGDFSTEDRSMLAVSLERKKGRIKEQIALNDAVVDKGSIARLLRFEVQIDRKHLTDYAADGLIVATPTGSTGYSMAAGGPLLHPSLAAFAVTPICPHMLSTRPVVIPDDSEVSVTLQSSTTDATLTLDGQVALPMGPGDIVRIRRSEHVTRLVRVPGRTYYEVLRRKLHWNRATE